MDYRTQHEQGHKTQRTKTAIKVKVLNPLSLHTAFCSYLGIPGDMPAGYLFIDTCCCVPHCPCVKRRAFCLQVSEKSRKVSEQ